MTDTQETVTNQEVEVDAGEVSYEVRIASITEMLNEISKVARQAGTELKSLSKDVKKQLKKKTKRTVKRESNGTPSGFARPTEISKELFTFLRTFTDGLEYVDKDSKESRTFEPVSELVARTEVTKRINRYIQVNDLRNDADKKILDLSKTGGEPLRTLLNVGTDAHLTYFNIQTFLKPHFPKMETASTEAVVAEAVATESSSAKSSAKVAKVEKVAKVTEDAVEAVDAANKQRVARARRTAKA